MWLRRSSPCWTIRSPPRSAPKLVLALSQEVRAGAEGLARLAAKALSREELTLAHTSLL